MIYRLKKEMLINRNRRQSLADKQAQLRASLEKTTSSLKDTVVGGSRKSSFDFKLNKITEIENEIKELDCEFEILSKEIEIHEQILKEFNDIKQLVYLEYKLKNINPIKIQMKYGISKSTFYRIINEIEDRSRYERR